MDFNSLYNFIVVVEELSFTKAAKRLFLSQQAVSSQIKKLEDECGVELFTRKPTLMPTTAGTSLYRTAIEIFRLQQEFQKDLMNISSGEAGEIRLGISYGRCRIFVPEIIKQMTARCPNVRLKVVESMASPRMEKAVVEGETDFYIGLTPTYTEQVNTIVLGDDSLLMVIPKKMMDDFRKTQGLAENESFGDRYSINALGKYPFILPSSDNSLRFIFNRYISTLHFTPNVLMESEQSDTLFFLSLEGVGISIYPAITYSSWEKKLSKEEIAKIETIPLTNMTENKMILGYNKQRRLSQMDNIFIDICRNIIYFRLT